MTTMLGDEDALRIRRWEVTDEPFEGVLGTTWDDLEAAGLIWRHKRSNPPAVYGLTEAGWVVGLKVSGQFDDAHFRQRCIALVQFFKSLVKGRELEGRVHYQNFPRELAPEWAINILKAGVLSEMFPDKEMNASWNGRMRSFHIARTFAMPKIDSLA